MPSSLFSCTVVGKRIACDWVMSVMVDEVESLTRDTELEDTDGRPAFDLGQLDFAALRDPIVLRAFLGIGLATLFLVWPERTDRVLARLIGVALVLIATSHLAVQLRAGLGRLLALLFFTGATGAGIFLLASPDRSDTFLGRVIGLVVALSALRDLAHAALDRSPSGTRSWVASRSIALLSSGGLLVAFPAEVMSIFTTVAAVAWIATSVLVVVIAVDRRTGGVSGYADVAQLVDRWLSDRPKSVEDREALYNKLFYDGPLTSRRVVRFFTLMTFAAVIASMGVITDSTAVVIGAMLIAPLMTPLMGMAMSLVMGWPRRLARSALVAAGGIALAIAIGVLLGLIVPAVIDTGTNSQILGRSSPTILDLITALAAGAAGAYGLSRPDVSDSLPGVAIAISLVPPLSVVGIAYSQTDWAAGNGALLLFTTNMVAILLMGGLTFVATGVTPITRVAENQHRVRTSVAALASVSVIVVGALLLNGAQIAANLLEQSSVENAVEQWLEGFPRHDAVRVVLDDDTVLVTIVGPAGDRPTAPSLAAELQGALERTMTVDLRLVVEERETATSRE